jgi:cellulose synthase/poly-beta-1,6-N-acetylglucosamine synthase-like glycosyltransferase
MIFQLFASFVLVLYAILIIAVSIGWWKLKVFKKSGTKPKISVSVIVAVRNEAINIEKLLQSLLKQDYQHLEIIIVDDHSTDGTKKLLEEISENLKTGQELKVLSLGGEDGIGKKAALSQGIKSSSGELIVITDADCTAGVSWIQSLASFYAEYKPQMILGPVRMADSGTIFGKLQSLEFISLISAAAGSCNAGFPLLANGANIAFTRQAFDTRGGFSENMQYPSGDDMFLMMNIKRKYGPRSIRFIKATEAIVNTPSTLGIKPFLHQRMRWVSKSRGYTDPLLILTSVLVFLVNACLVAAGISALIFPVFYKFFLLFFLTKLIIDMPLMLSYSKFQRSTALIWLFPVMELLNAVYTLFIGIVGNFGKYEWKGRKSSTNLHK